MYSHVTRLVSHDSFWMCVTSKNTFTFMYIYFHVTRVVNADVASKNTCAFICDTTCVTYEWMSSFLGRVTYESTRILRCILRRKWLTLSKHNTLQHTVTHCNTLQHTANALVFWDVLLDVTWCIHMWHMSDTTWIAWLIHDTTRACDMTHSYIIDLHVLYS
jgi:hypothetical protein